MPQNIGVAFLSNFFKPTLTKSLIIMQQKIGSSLNIVALGLVSCLFLSYSFLVDESGPTPKNPSKSCFSVVRIDKTNDDYLKIQDIDNRRVLTVKFIKSERMVIADSIAIRDTTCK